ncbi:MAG TPA: fumarylacetoacetate hydrolase family protein [Caulobacteraceae bacterium]|nr:fumarylacetoacetate hydrolase family protein [Caulobacteraceae bacterium]
MNTVRYVFEPPIQPSVAVAGSDARFPVRRIFCVGRNYAAHAREMGADDREPPFFFAKPADAAVDAGGTIPYPVDTADLHHEIELVCALGAGGADIPLERALEHVWGYAVGVDLTRRDRQAEAKAKARPWTVAKGFDRSAPISSVRPAEGRHPASGRIWLAVDGAVKQDADLADMTWNTAEIIAALSRSFELRPGDLIFTGTPEGVGPVGRGQTVTGGIDGVGEIRLGFAG